MDKIKLEICGVCRNCVKDNDSAIYCDGFCRSWYHSKCVNLTDVEYSKIGDLDSKVKWFCGSCYTRVDQVLTKIGNPEEFLNLNSIVSKLVTLVNGVVSDNLDLVNKLDVNIQLTNSLVTELDELKVKADRPVSSCTSATNIVDNNIVLNNSQGLVETSPSGRPNKDFVFTTLKPRPAVETPNSAKVHGKESTSDSLGPNQKPSYSSIVAKSNSNRPKVPRKTTPIIGTKVDVDLGTVRAVERKEWIFVSRLAREVNKEDIEKYLLRSNIKGECTKLRSRYETYSSFKVGVSPAHTPDLLNAEFWPSGTLICKFIEKSNFKPRSYTQSRTFLGKSLTHQPSA